MSQTAAGVPGCRRARALALRGRTQARDCAFRCIRDQDTPERWEPPEKTKHAALFLRRSHSALPSSSGSSAVPVRAELVTVPNRSFLFFRFSSSSGFLEMMPTKSSSSSLQLIRVNHSLRVPWQAFELNWRNPNLVPGQPSYSPSSLVRNRRLSPAASPPVVSQKSFWPPSSLLPPQQPSRGSSSWTGGSSRFTSTTSSSASSSACASRYAGSMLVRSCLTPLVSKPRARHSCFSSASWGKRIKLFLS